MECHSGISFSFSKSRKNRSLSALLGFSRFSTVPLQLCTQPGTRTAVANSLQKTAPLVQTIASNPVVIWARAWLRPVMQTLFQTRCKQKNTEIDSRCSQIWFGTVVHTRWNTRCSTTSNLFLTCEICFPRFKHVFPLKLSTLSTHGPCATS